MCLFRKRRHQDRIAREIAERYNLLDEYLYARRQGLSPIEALEEWDLLTTEVRKKIE